MKVHRNHQTSPKEIRWLHDDDEIICYEGPRERPVKLYEVILGSVVFVVLMFVAWYIAPYI